MIGKRNEENKEMEQAERIQNKKIRNEDKFDNIGF